MYNSTVNHSTEKTRKVSQCHLVSYLQCINGAHTDKAVYLPLMWLQNERLTTNCANTTNSNHRKCCSNVFDGLSPVCITTFLILLMTILATMFL